MSTGIAMARSSFAPLWWKDDFNNQALDTTNNWTLLDTGAATEALVEDAPNGVVALALDNTSEAQLAGLSWNDKRQLVLNQGLNIEYRFRFSVLPSASTSIVAIGLAGDHNATLDTVAESIIFRADGSGAITVENDDTSNETSKVATGVTVTTADWVVARIDCTTITDIVFYINGNRVAGDDVHDGDGADAGTAALRPDLEGVEHVGRHGADRLDEGRAPINATDRTVVIRTDQQGTLAQYDTITVDAVPYTVREIQPLEDGAFSLVSLR
jgi:hypothetical protein